MCTQLEKKINISLFLSLKVDCLLKGVLESQQNWTDYPYIPAPCCMHVCMCSVAKSYLILCKPMKCRPPGSSVHGISQAGILEWIAISFSRGPSLTKRLNMRPLLGKQILYHCATWEALLYAWKKWKWKLLSRGQLFATPWITESMEFSRPEWVAFPFSKGSSQSRDQTQVSCIAGGFFTSWGIREAICIASSISTSPIRVVHMLTIDEPTLTAHHNHSESIAYAWGYT